MSMLSGWKQSEAQEGSTKASLAATKAALKQQMKMYLMGRKDIDPWLTQGKKALNAYSGLYGIAGYAPKGGGKGKGDGDGGGNGNGGGGWNGQPGDGSGYQVGDEIPPSAAMGDYAYGDNGGAEGAYRTSAYGYDSVNPMAQSAGYGDEYGYPENAQQVMPPGLANMAGYPDERTAGTVAGGDYSLGGVAPGLDSAAKKKQALTPKNWWKGGNIFNSVYGKQTGKPDWAQQMKGFFESPQYQWNLNQGVSALDRSAAARGSLFGGDQIKAIQRYGSGLASGEFADYRNQLANLAGYGATAGQTGAGMAQGLGNNMSSLSLYGGAARSSGLMNQANAYGQQGQNNTMYAMMLGNYLRSL